MKSQLVYDIPTRIIHWFLAIGFIVAFAIAKLVDDESQIFNYHMILGISLLFAVLLRVGWGIWGSPYARFSSFILNPRQLLSYFMDIVQKKSKTYVGHNPASSWSGLVMKALVFCLAVSGILMTYKFHKDIVEDFHEIFSTLFVVVAAFHVAGIILHTLLHKDPIGWSMFHGKKQILNAEAETVKSHAFVGFLYAISLIVFMGYLAFSFSSEDRSLNIFGATLQLGEAD